MSPSTQNDYTETSSSLEKFYANKRNTTMPAKTKKKSKPEFIVDESFVGEPFDLRLLEKATVRTITKKTKLLDLSKKNLRLIRNALKPSAI